MLLLVSEGGRDVGDDADVERRGAVRAFVERVLAAKWKRPIQEHEIETEKLWRLHGRSGYEAKVRMAIIEAELRGASCVAVLVDRDGVPGTQRLQLLRAGRALAEQDGRALALNTAVGVAVESVEAWLIADEVAVSSALGLEPAAQAFPDPEALPAGEAKRLFLDAVAKGTSTMDPYGDVARSARLHVVETRCPSGFATFADEVRQHTP